MNVPIRETPDLRWIGDRCFEVVEPFVWYDDKKGAYITIPVGFVCDGASIPQAADVVVEPGELSEAAWLLHDYLYRYQGAPPKLVPPFARYTRAEVDDLFNRVNKRHGVIPWKRRLAYVGVRIGGYFAWRGEKQK